MNKEKFLSELRGKLTVLSSEERELAIKYYEEYFDDAGIENEQSVLNELGSVDNVAQTILKENNYPISITENTNDNSNKTNVNNIEYTSVNLGPIIILILVIVFAFPIIFPLFIGLLGVLFGFIVAGFCISLSGVVVIGFGIGAFFSSAFTGMLTLGLGLIILAIGIALSNFTIWIFKITVPVCFRGFVGLFKSLFRKGGVII